jgi:NADH-quinone oxidoreductase subunit C
MPRVEADRWHAEVAAALAAGFTNFVTLMAIDDAGLAVWLRLRNAQGVDLVLAATVEHGVATITDLLPAASWHEREAAEMFGINFRGHELQPLILQGDANALMQKAALLSARQDTAWPGEKDPGGVTARRRTLPPGVDGGGR